MSLTKKEIKHYKPLISSKLQEMGVKNEIGYAKTGSSKLTPQLVKTEAGFKVENQQVPNYRAANLHKSLIKKLLNMDPKAIEKFLETVIPSKEKSDEQTAETLA